MVANLENEIWERHPKYTDWFGSNLGRVKHINNKGEEKLNKLTPIKDGYLMFGICEGSKIIAKPLVHRFVYECFHQCIIPDDLEINHRNCKRDSNFIENLELLDHQANIDYSVSKKVGQYTLDGNLLRVWKSTSEAGRNGYARSHIAACCRGERKTHKNFIWQYIKSENPPQKINVSKINNFKPKVRINNPKISKKVAQFDLGGNLVKVWESTNECQRNGYNQGAIAACCRNCFNRQGNNIYRGYIWKYIEEK